MFIKLGKKKIYKHFPQPDEIEKFVVLKIPIPRKIIIILAILLSFFILFLLTNNAKSMTPTVRQRCKIYSRIVGYYSSTDDWNPGKKSEFHSRVNFSFPSDNSLTNQNETNNS